LLRKNI